jgi:hypothetical protein
MRFATRISVFLFALAATGLAHGSPVRDLQHELGIDDSKWTVAKETESEIDWTTPGGEAVTLMVHQRPSEMTDPKDQKALQAVFRDEARDEKGGLVEVQTFVSSGVTCGLVTMKFPMKVFDPKASGYGYQINAIIPMKNASYVLQVAAGESEPTGTREAMVTVADMEQRKIKDLAQEAAGFRRDPYDSKYDADALYMISDDRKWDKAFPDHPLTRARRLIDTLIKGWKLSAKTRQDALFK